MTDIRIKAAVEAVLKRFESEKTFNRKEKYTVVEHIALLEKSDVFIELKAALKPSKGEISDHLQTIVNFHYKPEKDAKWIWYAIEELRGKEEMTALRPSREDVAHELKSYLSMQPAISKTFKSNVNYAIEELRK